MRLSSRFPLLTLAFAALGGPLVAAPPSAVSPAVAEARKKVRDLDFEISRAESERRRLSPPIRITDRNGTTFDKDKQRQYEMNVERADRRIAELRREKSGWEMRALSDSPVERPGRADFDPRDRGDLGPRREGRPAEFPALAEARKKVRDLDFEISRAESERRRLSPPIRITDRNGTTFDKDKQRQYEMNVERADRRISELRREKSGWEMRANELH